MRPPPVIDDEAARLAVLRAYAVLDTPPEASFDRLTRTAAAYFCAPIALMSLVDEERQWFKSRVGLAASETHREVSFCGHAIAGDDVLVVPDARADERFHDNPLVTGSPHIRFYAGAPITAPAGHRLGTVCVIDTLPRRGVDDGGRAVLRDLAGAVLDALELRRAVERERHATTAFLARAAHELRTPLAAITGFAELLALDDTTPVQRVYAQRVVDGGRLLAELIDDIVDTCVARKPAAAASTSAIAEVIAAELERVAPLATARGVDVVAQVTTDLAVDSRRTGRAVGQLLANAVTYHRRGGRVDVVVGSRPGGWVRVDVVDDGDGLAPADLARVFEPFFRAAPAGDVPGSGLGLTLVKTLVEGMGGTAGASSAPGCGSTFWLEVPGAA